MPVLGTPRLIAWLEAATVQAAAPHCGPGETSVGTAVRIEHLRATPVRGSVTVEAVLSSPPAGRTLTLEVRATDGTGEVVATGEIDRVVVDRERFVARSTAP